MTLAMTTLYVDLKGDDIDHANYLESEVSTLLRGMGLARRTREHAEEAQWPGCVSMSTVSEDRTVRRISVGYEVLEHATKDGRTLAEFLLANAWSKHLLAVFVVQASRYSESYSATYDIHGKARSLRELSLLP